MLWLQGTVRVVGSSSPKMKVFTVLVRSYLRLYTMKQFGIVFIHDIEVPGLFMPEMLWRFA